MSKLSLAIVFVVLMYAAPSFAQTAVGKIDQISMEDGQVYITVVGLDSVGSCPTNNLGRTKLEVDYASELGQRQLQVATAAYLAGQNVRIEVNTTPAANGNCQLARLKLRAVDN